MTTWEPPDRIPASVLRYTQVAPGKRGTRAYVFCSRVEHASISFTASLDKVLSVAIAHAFGHMLLPDGKHAKAGVMAAPWDSSRFRSASAGLLLFSDSCAQRIRRELEGTDTLTALEARVLK